MAAEDISRSLSRAPLGWVWRTMLVNRARCLRWTCLLRFGTHVDADIAYAEFQG